MWKFIREELFPNFRTGALTIFAFAGWWAAAAGYYAKAFSLVDKYAPNWIIESYLWTSVFINCTTFAGIYAVYRAVVAAQAKRAAERVAIAAETEAAASAIILLHKMAEKVRHCAFASSAYDCQVELQHVLGEGVRGFLKLRLGDNSYSITVKEFERKAGGQDTLRSVFRDQGQNDKVRINGEVESLDGCHIFKRFEDQDQDQTTPSRWVMVSDVKQLSVSKAIVQRGSARNYRSTIAFPLRMPMSGPPSARVAQLIGFLSVDCPDPGAFDGLFSLKPGVAQSGLHGEGFDEDPDMNLFFGLADSVATILVLNRQRVVESKGPTQ